MRRALLSLSDGAVSILDNDETKVNEFRYDVLDILKQKVEESNPSRKEQLKPETASSLSVSGSG